MMPARNLCFTYAKEEPRRAGDVLAGPRDLRSARAAGRRAALLPSLRRSSPQASHAQGTAALSVPSERGPNLSGRAEGILFAQSKHLWRTICACAMLTLLPAVRETLRPREVLKHALTPPPKYVQISPLVPRRHSLLLLSHPQQQKIILHSLTLQRHTKTF